MKVVAIILRVLGSVLIVVGALFKIQHWPFSEALLISGLAAFGVLLMLPVLTKWLQSSEEKYENVLDHERKNKKSKHTS